MTERRGEGQRASTFFDGFRFFFLALSLCWVDGFLFRHDGLELVSGRKVVVGGREVDDGKYIDARHRFGEL